MDTVHAYCPTCGDVFLTVRDLELRVCFDNELKSFAFRCPDCKMRCGKTLSAQKFDELVSHGAIVVVWHLPDELYEVMRRKCEKPFAADEVLDIYQMITEAPDEQLLEHFSSA